MCILIFSTTFISNICQSNNNSATYCHKYENVFVQSTRYSCRNVMKLQFSRHILEKSSNIKFHRNPSSGSRVTPHERTDGRMDVRTDVMKLTVAFRNFSNTPKKVKCFPVHAIKAHRGNRSISLTQS
jgi:hypothetical protein